MPGSTPPPAVDVIEGEGVGEGVSPTPPAVGVQDGDVDGDCDGDGVTPGEGVVDTVVEMTERWLQFGEQTGQSAVGVIWLNTSSVPFKY